MLLLSTKLNNIPLVSVRSGARIGTILGPIINPNNLHIDAFWCQTINSTTPKVLLDTDIREFSMKGVLINDHLGLSDPDELVRLSSVLDIKYKLEGKAVIANKRKLGKLAEYAVDVSSLFIQKLYVQPSVWKGSIAGTRLTFDRGSVLEVNDTQIIVSGPEQKVDNAVSLKASGGLATYSSASTSLMSENE